MAKRKKRYQQCLFCDGEDAEPSTYLFTTDPDAKADGICDGCVRRFFRKLCEMNLLSVLETRTMTRH